MKPTPSETDLTGTWIFESGKMRGDAICDRIDWLTTQHLRQIAVSEESGGWDTLYQDPDDGRFWEHTYPQGYLQGAGPPRLTVLSTDQAHAKYKF